MVHTFPAIRDKTLFTIDAIKQRLKVTISLYASYNQV